MITVERHAFAKALALAGSVIKRRNPISVLGGIKVTANGSLRFEGSDLDMTAETEIHYEGKAIESFSLMDPARVRSAINAAGGPTVTLANKVNRAAIASGALSAMIATLPADDHPGSERIADQRFAADLGGGELAALQRVRSAISTEETRYYLNGVCVRKIGEWLYRFAATDGHRLMVVDIPLPNAEGELPENAIIPRRFLDKAFQHFAKAPEGMRLTYGGKQLSNEAEKTLAPGAMGAARIAMSAKLGPVRLTLASKFIDGTYPDYGRVVPTASPHAVRLRRDDLLQAIRSLTPLASEKTRAVKINAVKGALRLSLNSPDLGSGQYDVPAEHNLPKDWASGFNGQYLVDCLEGLRGEEVSFAVDTGAAPALIKDPADGTFFAVLMPMRV